MGMSRYTCRQRMNTRSAAIYGGNTATPSVQFIQRGASVYNFLLTVTDSAGNTATDLATLTYQGN